MSRARLYLDEDALDDDVLAGLRARGIDAVTAAEAGMVSRDDEDHLVLAASQGRVLYSFNGRDFYRIHSKWIAAGQDHAGIILAKQQRSSVGEQIRRLSLLIETLSAEDMRNRVESSAAGEDRPARSVRGFMFAFEYPAQFKTGSDGRVLVDFIDLPRVATDGKDAQEAMAEAMDALGSDLSIRLTRHEEIPEPSEGKRGQRLVPAPLWLAPKLALYLAMRDRRITNLELARRLGVHEKVVRRMLNPAHATRADRIQAALAVLGKQMTVEVRDAA